MPGPFDRTLRDVEQRLIEPAGDGSAIGLRDRMAHYAVPGVALALIADGEIVCERGYGVREAGRSEPVEPTTRFQACSISKPVAVLGALRLVERGVLDLDADVNDLLTSWCVPPNASWQPRVTLRQLASHSAGLTVSGFPGYGDGAPLPSLERILTGRAPANTPGVRVDTLPGAQFRYAGGGTTVLQQVLEDVTGRPFSELMQELVLEPLGMTCSDYEQPLRAELYDEAATAHRSNGSPVQGRWHVYPELAAAGLWTTAGDLARFAVGVQRAARGTPGSILGPELAAAMLTRHVDSTERIGGLDAVGLGLFLGGRPDTTVFGHSGGNEGFRCHLLAHRAAGWGMVAMTNGDRGHSLIQEVANALGRAMEWPDYEPAEPPDAAEPRSALDSLTGMYEFRPGATVTVSRMGDDLSVEALGQEAIRFIRISETEFGSFSLETTLRFASADETGAPQLVLHQNGEELPCRRVG